MSDIVDRLRNPKRALWYCREFSRGDDESLDIQEAADEIERLRGLLQRHHELRGKPAREEWVDGGPTYRLAMQLWRDTAAALAGAAVQPSAAPVEYECVGYQYKFPSMFTNGSTWRDSPADYNGIRSTGSRKIFAEVTTDPTDAAP